jgi:Immunity protein 63
MKRALGQAAFYFFSFCSGPSKETEVVLDSSGYLCYVTNDWRRSYNFICYDEDDLLFRVFDTITSMMASRYIKENMKENEDFSSLCFNKRQELLGKLNIEWSARLKKQHEIWRPSP